MKLLVVKHRSVIDFLRTALACYRRQAHNLIIVESITSSYQKEFRIDGFLQSFTSIFSFAINKTAIETEFCFCLLWLLITDEPVSHVYK